MKQVISTGKQNFRSLREKGCFYVDKTNFIKEWWESEKDVTFLFVVYLIPHLKRIQSLVWSVV